MKYARCLVVLLITASVAVAAPANRLDDPVEGKKLARELTAAVPAEEVTFRGVLRISAPKTPPREVPIESRVAIDKESWRAIYTAKLPDGTTEALTVRHFPDRPNEYELRRGDSVRQFSGAAATNSFAGSDFALLDLGMEFYHWQQQRIVTREMRKGRGCDVLESRPEATLLYSRVLSWIDQESREQGQPGLLMAEAYDRTGRLLKEFEVKGFKRVAGQWQVQEMELRNRQSKSSTRLQFRFD
jgi:hypothetical protein